MNNAKDSKDPVYGLLKDLRKKRDFSQAEIGAFLGMEQAGYSQLEEGKTRLTIERLRKLAEFYNLPLAYFFENNVREIVDKNLETLMELIQTNEENGMNVSLKPFEEHPETNDMLRRMIQIQDDNLKQRSEIIKLLQNELLDIYFILERVYNVHVIKKMIGPVLVKQIQNKLKNQLKSSPYSISSFLQI